MIIGIDASRANKTIKTGTEWYSWQLIQELKRIPQTSGIKFILYSPEPLRGDLRKLPKEWQSKVLKWLPKYFWTQIRLAWEIKKTQIDLLFVPAHVIPRVHPARTVVTCHDIGFKRFPGAYSFWQKEYLDWSTRFALKHASKIIAISQFTKNELIDIYKADPEKIEVVYLGYDDKIFHLNVKNQIYKIEQVLAKYKISKPYILYVGRLEEKKNIAGLIEAFKVHRSLTSTSLLKSDFNKLRLILVGNPGYGYKNLKSQILNLKSVIELGYVDQKDLPYLYAGAEVFVFPSFYEGFGMPVLEAMACGTPVVASNTSSIPEVAGNAALLVDPHNPAEIAEAIKQIIGDSQLKEELIRKGLERVKNFSWQKCASQTLDILLNC